MARQISIGEAMERATQLAKRGDTAEAARLYGLVLAQQPGNKKARKSLKRLQGSDGSSLSEADFERVSRLMSSGRLDAAKTDIARLCHLHPNQPALHNLRGVILSRRGEKDAALAAFQEALRLEPAFAEALNNFASTLSDLGRFTEALGFYRELVKRGQADAEIYTNLAHALTGAGQKDNAVEALQRAIKLRPLFPDAYNDLGNLLNDLGRHAEAVEAYESALRMEPGHIKALGNLAQTLTQLQQPVPALKAYRQLHDLEPQNPLALVGMAQVLSNLGQTTAAIERYEQALVLNPDDAIAQHLLAALRGERREAAAPGYARAVFENYAANFEAHLTKTLDYSLPGKLPALLEQLDGADAWYPSALDLGCGTGLVGAQVRSYCEQLVGIDLAPAMLEKAAEKAVYDTLLAGDVISTMTRDKLRFDLAIGADVLVYMGALESFFAALAQGAQPAARIVVSTEALDGDGFALRPTGRFAHARDYVIGCASAAGLAQRHHEEMPLRKERGEWLSGDLFVFMAPGERSA